MKVYLVAILALLLIFPMVTAVDKSIPPVKQGDCANLYQVCDNCSYVNISSIVVPNSLVTYGPFEMSKADTYYNYTFCDTQNLGTLIYTTCGDLNGQPTCESVSFEVTATGKGFDIGKSIAYVLIFVFSFILMISFIIGGYSIDSKNKSDEFTGYVFAVSNKKYLKYFLYGLSWVIALWISYFSWMISYSYLDMQFMSDILKVVFTTMTVITLPLFILFCYVLIANLVRDSKIKEMLERGLRVK